MKLTKLVLGFVVAIGLAGMIGCGNKGGATSDAMKPMVVEGVNVDMPKLQAEVDKTGNADLQSSVRNVVMSFRYRQYDKALMDMEKIVNDPGLNAEQKKLATDVFEQVKQVAAKAPPPAQ